MLSEYYPTSPDADLAEGAMLGVVADEEFVLLARVQGRIHAISDICSHFHTHLSNGELLPERCLVQCPLHDSSFDLRTGEPTDPPAEDPVTVYGVKVVDGVIYVGPRSVA